MMVSKHYFRYKIMASTMYNMQTAYIIIKLEMEI